MLYSIVFVGFAAAAVETGTPCNRQANLDEPCTMIRDNIRLCRHKYYQPALDDQPALDECEMPACDKMKIFTEMNGECMTLDATMCTHGGYEPKVGSGKDSCRKDNYKTYTNEARETVQASTKPKFADMAEWQEEYDFYFKDNVHYAPRSSCTNQEDTTKGMHHCPDLGADSDCVVFRRTDTQYNPATQIPAEETKIPADNTCVRKYPECGDANDSRGEGFACEGLERKACKDMKMPGYEGKEKTKFLDTSEHKTRKDQTKLFCRSYNCDVGDATKDQPCRDAPFGRACRAIYDAHTCGSKNIMLGNGRTTWNAPMCRWDEGEKRCIISGAPPAPEPAETSNLKANNLREHTYLSDSTTD